MAKCINPQCGSGKPALGMRGIRTGGSAQIVTCEECTPDVTKAKLLPAGPTPAAAAPPTMTQYVPDAGKRGQPSEVKGQPVAQPAEAKPKKAKAD